MTRQLINFSEASEVARWYAINDVVMGGISDSRLDPLPDGGAAFRGEVSLANSGGFASIRRLDERWDLGGYDALDVKVCGDGKRYSLRLKVESGFDGIVYQARFDATPGSWESVYLAFGGFAPSFRGRRVPGAGPLDPATIVSIGLMISDKQLGPFELRLRRIAAVHAR
jgi:hypothetical protein